MKYSNPKSRASILFRYLMYQIGSLLVLEVFVGLTLIDHLTIKQIVLYTWPAMLPYIVVPVLAFTLWYGGSRVSFIEYDYDSKTFVFWHYNWLFQHKSKVIHFDDFRYRVYHIMLTPYFFFLVTWIPIKDTRNKRILLFTSGLGWKRKQVDEIISKLKEIKEPDLYW